MDQIHLHHHHHLIPQQHHNLPQPQPLGGITMNVDMSSGGVGVAAAVDRLPQWSVQETKEFLRIRAELDQNFMETKRNKQLWQLISNSMADKGYFRSPEQCKCKWKNLFTRYKGCETAEPESVRQQFPFYKELEAIFTARMQRMVWTEAEGGTKKNTATAAAAGNVSSEDEEDDNNNNEEISTDNHQGEMRTRKKMKRSSKSYSSSSKKLKEILEEFMKQQIEIETQWMEAFREREKERRMREMEWREAMEALENERMMMEQRWREREEERRVREEARAERRDALITSLLNKIIARPEI